MPVESRGELFGLLFVFGFEIIDRAGGNPEKCRTGTAPLLIAKTPAGDRQISRNGGSDEPGRNRLPRFKVQAFRFSHSGTIEQFYRKIVRIDPRREPAARMRIIPARIRFKKGKNRRSQEHPFQILSGNFRSNRKRKRFRLRAVDSADSALTTETDPPLFRKNRREQIPPGIALRRKCGITPKTKVPMEPKLTLAVESTLRSRSGFRIHPDSNRRLRSKNLFGF